jgi:hypothetical protein
MVSVLVEGGGYYQQAHYWVNIDLNSDCQIDFSGSRFTNPILPACHSLEETDLILGRVNVQKRVPAPFRQGGLLILGVD